MPTLLVTKCGHNARLSCAKHGAHLVGCEPLHVSSTRMTWCTWRQVIPPSLSAEDEDEDEDFDEKAILAEAEDATSC